MERRIRRIDILSGLPEEVLCHILSFLPTKTSVCTSVLAKRWRFMWKHVPNLEFQGSRLDNIHRVIMQHEAKTVNTFKLSYMKASAYQLDTLIFYPIKCGVRKLCLEFCLNSGGDIACTVPRLLFTCKTLVDLKLVCCGVIPSGGELFLPSLKKLNLRYVDYESDESFPHLLSGCPVLEELIVHNCLRVGQNNTSCLIVSSLTIKTLIVDFSELHDQFPNETLRIDVPALVYLKVNHCELRCMKSLRKTMTSLIRTEFILNGEGCIYCGFDCIDHGRSIAFLSCLCHVSYLKITGRMCDTCDQLFDMVGTGSMPKFVNLTELELDAGVDWCNVVKFLEVADNLEVLVINLHDTSLYMKSKRVPPCMLSRLRTVRMCFRECGVAFDVVRYILMNARVLEMMEIDPVNGASAEENLAALQRISLFKRVSKSCQVAFNTRL